MAGSPDQSLTRIAACLSAGKVRPVAFVDRARPPGTRFQGWNFHRRNMYVARPDDMHDREAEWHALEAMWHRPRPQLAFVLGRRRVGKSFTLSRFARAVGGLY